MLCHIIRNSCMHPLQGVVYQLYIVVHVTSHVANDGNSHDAAIQSM